MERKTYSEKLKDPRWQKKRLEILNRDEFTCCFCFNKESTLNVHHIKYNNEPWETDERYLISLCSNCHKNIEDIKADIKHIFDEFQSTLYSDGLYETVNILKSIYEKKLNPYELSTIHKIIENFKGKDYQRYFNKYSNK